MDFFSREPCLAMVVCVDGDSEEGKEVQMAKHVANEGGKHGESDVVSKSVIMARAYS
jgi:hypothetical protein